MRVKQIDFAFAEPRRGAGEKVRAMGEVKASVFDWKRGGDKRVQREMGMGRGDAFRPTKRGCMLGDERETWRAKSYEASAVAEERRKRKERTSSSLERSASNSSVSPRSCALTFRACSPAQYRCQSKPALASSISPASLEGTGEDGDRTGNRELDAYKRASPTRRSIATPLTCGGARGRGAQRRVPSSRGGSE